MADGGYGARNGARDAPQLRKATDGSTLGEDFPMLCETCLGPNPYVRMTKLPYGHKLCKISNLPFQAFKWKAGPGGRYKETIISYSVAAERNICQCCLNDMVYGLPVGVRDAILNKPDNQIALPESFVGQQYFYEQQAQMVASGQVASQGGGIGGNNMITDLTNVAKSRQLDKLSRSLQVAEAKSKVAFRNLPKLCSFWLGGGCTRVLRKTCPYRPCCGVYAFPEIAGSHRDLCKKLVADLEEKGPAVMQKELDSETRTAIQEAQRGNRDDAIRSRVSGEDDLAKKYLGKIKSMRLELDPPADLSIITLWIGGIEEDISESDLRAVIYPFGQISAIHMVRSAKCAFVEYVDREAAEAAAGQLYKALMVKGRALNVNWARPKIQQNAALAGADAAAAAGDVGTMLPPPGMERAPTSAYALPAPPPGPPPAAVSAGSSSGGGLKSGRRGEQGSGGYSNNNDSSKRQRLTNQNQPPPPPSSAPPGSSGIMSLLTGYGDDDDDDDDAVVASAAVAGGGKATPAPPAAALRYPSMNPTRMGSKV